MFQKTQRIFMDYASTTPTDKRVVREMLPFFTKNFHNASALYKEGVCARNVIDEARKKIAQIVQSKTTEIIFTSSGTESDNLGIVGVAREILKNLRKEKINFKPHVITTNIEHVAVLESFKQLDKEGFDVTYLPVDEKGLVKDSDVRNVLRPETILVSIMLANNEIGTILPVRQIGVVLDQYKKSENRIKTEYPYLHTDASQAANYLEINIDRLNADLLTLDGSKIYGPKGIGCLVIKSYVPVQPILYGGGHEFGMRPGTENVPLIVGFAKALEITQEIKEKESKRLKVLQKYFLEILSIIVPNAILNGDLENRLPNNINVCIPNINSEFAVIQLDEMGIACAATTACKNLSSGGSSYVIQALGRNCEKTSLRFTFGRDTTKSEIKKVVSLLNKI
jgi:cysteine desulfurase